jgi:hypothetical protein
MSALIPWVCALVAILGCNALGSPILPLRKMKSLDGSSLIQLSLEIPAAGNTSNSLVFLSLNPSDDSKLFDPSSRFYAIASRTDLPAANARGGEKQGRAPPVEVR